MKTKAVTAGILASLIAVAPLAGTVSAQSLAGATDSTTAQAIEVALADEPGEIETVERENEDGTEIFEVKIITADEAEAEIEIHAMTGEIHEMETEEEDDDD